ncbi:hypothetical protein JL722_12787 [Aureococcus anophagefferens]|nr:hypothetical protein JL722_12787 [Aureococcus anophagefferens]
MRATDAPEPRDVLWDNVFVGRGSVLRRQWVVAGGVFTLMLFWFTVVTWWCSSTTRLVTLIFDWDVEDEGLVERSTYQVLPIAALLSIVNLLPLCFQAIARFYERLKSHSAVDLSVVERFFRFQFINVYVSILANAILKDLQKAWHSPVTFVLTIGQKTPDAALYFAKLLIFQCGTSPLWSLRAWPLLAGLQDLDGAAAGAAGHALRLGVPKVMMTLTIFCTFWVFAPLVSVFAFVYFVLISFQFRYLILFCHMPVYESGACSSTAVERVLFGLAISNVILALWLLFQQMVGDALLVAPLPFVAHVPLLLPRGLRGPSLTMSLDEAARATRTRAPRRALRPQCYAQPALKHQGLPPDGPRSPGDRVHAGVAAKRREPLRRRRRALPGAGPAAGGAPADRTSRRARRGGGGVGHRRRRARRRGAGRPGRREDRAAC